MPGESQLPPGNAPDPSVATKEALALGLDAERDFTVAQLDVLRERLSGMDRATALLSETVNRTPTAIQTAVGQLRELSEAKFDQAGRVADEKFSSIGTQFKERDIRTLQASERDAQALAAALQAAKELVGSQGDATAAAAVKSETSFTKQIDQIGTIIGTLEKAMDARLTELKERIDRGEGSRAGTSSAATFAIGVLGLLVAVLVPLVVYALAQ